VPSLSRPIYVSPTGDPVTGQGTLRRPFATVQAAADLRRSRGWNSTMTGQEFVYLQAGNLDAPATLGPADSGAGVGREVVYQNAPGTAVGAPVVGGGYRASKWVAVGGGIFKTAIAGPCYTLYENGQRAVMARTPVLNPEVGFPRSFTPYLTSQGVDNSETVVKYAPGDLNPAAWVGITRVAGWSRILAVPTDWFYDAHQIVAADTVNRLLTLQEGMKFFAESPPTPMRYYVEGDISFLTGAGQFVTQNDADGWHLYYWPRATPIASQDIVIPTSKRIVQGVGTDFSTHFHDVKFVGISAAFTDFDSWYRYGTDGAGVEYDYFYTLPRFQQGNFYLEHASNVTIASCHGFCSGYEGLFLQLDVTNCLFSNSFFERTGTGGVSANGPYPGAGDTLHSNTYFNIKVANYGELDGSANGIRWSQSSRNSLTHFDVSEGPNRGVWSHGDFDVDPADNYNHSNYIAFGKATNNCQDSGDRGGVTISFCSEKAIPPPNPNPANLVEQVIITNTRANSTMLDTQPNGLFCDNQTFRQQATCVQVINSQGPQARWNDSGDWTLDNCSFLATGLPNPSFDPTRMSSSIGLTAAFPY